MNRPSRLISTDQIWNGLFIFKPQQLRLKRMQREFMENAQYCKSCNAKIIWMKTKNGKSMPVNFSDVLKDATAATVFNHKEHVSHFATCPEADQYKSHGNDK